MSSSAADSPPSYLPAFRNAVLGKASAPQRDKAVKLLLALALCTLIVLTWRYGAQLKSFTTAFTELLANQGTFGIAAFVAVGVLWILLFLPASMIFLASGAAWGLQWGLAIAFTINFLSGAAAFGIAKHFLEPHIKTLKPQASKLALVRRAVQREGVRGAALLRFSALPAWAINYGLGAAGLSWKHYFAVSLAILPNTWAFVAGGHAAGLASQSSSRSSTEWALLITSILGTAIVMALLGRRTKNILEKTAASSESDETISDKSTESSPP